MCGIIGFTGNNNQAQLSLGLRLIRHRGRDSKTQSYYPGLNWGMNRLAINDLSPNLYPMKYKHYELIINGEIYNYPALKNKLKKLGYTCKTRCDAEVVLPLYHKYGDKAFAKLEGMFAIAIIDKRNNQLILARDKFGEKPLYYHYLKNKSFSFASEMKVLSKLVTSKQLNTPVLTGYLRHGSVVGDKTFVCHIFKLLPGTCLSLNMDTIEATSKSYWRPKLRPLGQSSESELVELLDTQLNRSVQQRLLADVPVGAFLSGGVDSSLITALIQKHVSQLNTYSVTFPNQPRYNEALFSTRVSNYLETHHTVVECTPDSVKQIIDKIGQLIDEPISDPAVLPTYLMAQAARKSVKVVLTGEGADELFGGYYRYRKYLANYRLQHNPLYLQSKKFRDTFFPKRFKRIYDSNIETYSPQSIWQTDELSTLLKLDRDESVSTPETQTDNVLQSLQLSDLQGYLPNQLLMKVDKFTMLHNLEARAPYLDTRIADIGLNLPEPLKIKGVHTKYLLRKVAERYLPKYIAWRWKQGFSLPLDEWYRGELKDFVTGSVELAHEYNQLVDAEEYVRIVDLHMNGQENYRDKIWSLGVLLYWIEQNKIVIP